MTTDYNRPGLCGGEPPNCYGHSLAGEVRPLSAWRERESERAALLIAMPFRLWANWLEYLAAMVTIGVRL